MKKIIKISIGVVLLLMVSASFVYAAPFTWTNEVGGIKTTPVSVTTSDGNTTVSMNAIKPDGDAENVTFILTIYNKTTKRLENVKMQTLLVGNTLTSFSFENIPGITANHEINTSIVSLTNKFMPMGMPMNMPANEDAVNLKDLKIDGVSVINKFDDEGNLTYLLPKKFTNNQIVPYTWDGVNSIVVPSTLDAGSTVDFVNENTFPDKQTLTVTAIDGREKDYVINYMYPSHAVRGAVEDTDFEEKSTRKYDVTIGSTNTVATTHLGGDGILYTNLHAFSIDGTDIVANSGSVPFSNYVANTNNSYWLITAINDEAAVGADYFGIDTNTGNTFGEGAKYDGINPFNTLEDGTEWFKFTLTYPARVTLYATVDAIAAYEADGWIGESNTTTPYITCHRADKISIGNSDSRYTPYAYKVYKDFPAGEVVIKYHTVLNGNARAPFITVKH